MTVNTTNITSGPYQGNGVADTFSYTFRVTDKSQVSVYETDSNGVQTLLTVDTDYTVAGIGDDDGGTITRTVGALPNNYEWFIRSNYQETQLTAFESQGAYFPDLHENMADKLTFLIQQLRDTLNRSFRLSDSYSGSASTELPDPEALRYVRWNSLGTALELVNGTPSTTIASDVAYTPDEGLSSTNVQDVIDEVNSLLGTVETNQNPLHSVAGALSSPVNAINRFNLTKQGSGSGNVIQDFCVDPYLDELYTIHITGSPETTVINKFAHSGIRTQTSNRWTATPNAVVGHQGFDVSWASDGTRWFWTAAGKQQTNDDFSVVRFQITDGAGTDLTVSNTGLYLLFPTDFSVISNICTCAVSSDGRWLIAEVRTDTTENTIRVFDLQTLIDGGPGDYSVGQHAFEFVITNIISDNHPLQGLACDGASVYVFAGINPTDNLRFGVYNFKGETLYLDADFTVGETKAQGDGAGTDYEAEGLGWVWHGGEPRLTCVIASGDSGSRVNRLWMLSTSAPVRSFGEGNEPSFLASGAKDFGVPSTEVCRMGHYDPVTDTFNDRLGFDTSGVTLFGNRNSGTFTVTVEDSSTKGAGNISATTAVGNFARIGDMMFVQFSISNINTAGMTGGNNIYFHGTALSPASADSNFTMTPVSTMALAGTMYFSDVTYDASGTELSPAIESTGAIAIREMRDNAVFINANVSQFSGADVNLSGWFKV